MSPRLPFQSGASESNRVTDRARRPGLGFLLLPKQACSHLHLRPMYQSERQRPIGLSADRCPNLRSPGPRPGAFQTSPRSVHDPCGSRTQPDRLERPMTSPEVERAVSFSHARSESAKSAGRRSNPRLRFFRPPLDHLSYQPIDLKNLPTKKARCRFDTGPCWLIERVGQVS